MSLDVCQVYHSFTLISILPNEPCTYIVNKIK
jgi:hypothetical protein